MSGWRGSNSVTYIIFQITSYSIKAQMLEILKFLLSQAIWKLFMQYLYRMCLTGKGLFQDGGPKCPPGLNLPQEFQKKPGLVTIWKMLKICSIMLNKCFFVYLYALQWETVGIEWDFLIYIFYVCIHMQWI